MIEFIIVLGFVGTVWFLRTGGMKMPHFPGTNLGNSIKKIGVGPRVISIAIVAILFIFWGSISSGTASLLVKSDFGSWIGWNVVAVEKTVGENGQIIDRGITAVEAKKQTEKSIESVQRWLFIPGILLSGWLLLRAFKPKNAADSVPSGGNAVQSFFDGLTTLIVIAVIGAVVIFGAYLVRDIVLMIAGVPLSTNTAKSFQEPEPAAQYYAPVAQPEVVVMPPLPRDIRVLCQDESRRCVYIPRSDQVQKVVLDRDVGPLCVNTHVEPGRETPYTMDAEKVTYTIPPNTDFWGFYLKLGEEFLGRGVCGA